MSDEALRRSARRRESSGDPADEARWLAEQLRVGEMPGARIELAAALGDPAAALARPRPAPGLDAEHALEALKQLGAAIGRAGTEAAARAALGDALALEAPLRAAARLSAGEAADDDSAEGGALPLLVHLRSCRARLEDAEEALSSGRPASPGADFLAYIIPQLDERSRLLERAVEALSEHLAGSHQAFRQWWGHRVDGFWGELYWEGDPGARRALLAARLRGEPVVADLRCLRFLDAVAAELVPWLLGREDPIARRRESANRS
ncbi:MAG: hypothetical protein AB7N76_14445 [Planctomycetota bacterium]